MYFYARILKAPLSDGDSAGKINSVLACDCETVPGSQPALILCNIDLHYLHRTGLSVQTSAWFLFLSRVRNHTHFKSGHLFLSKEHKASEQTCRIPEILLSLLVYVTFCQHFFNILDHYYTKCFNKCIRQSKSILA